MANFCNNCRKKLLPNAIYCNWCGVLVSGKSNEKATIEISRTSRLFGKFRDFDIYIDGMKIGSISNNSSKKFEINPGTHTLQLKISWTFSKTDTLTFRTGVHKG